MRDFLTLTLHRRGQTTQNEALVSHTRYPTALSELAAAGQRQRQRQASVGAAVTSPAWGVGVVHLGRCPHKALLHRRRHTTRRCRRQVVLRKSPTVLSRRCREVYNSRNYRGHEQMCGVATVLASPDPVTSCCLMIKIFTHI